MADTAKSILEEETSKFEPKSKRGADVEDADVTLKKFKTEAAADKTGARNLEAVNGDEELKVIKREVEFVIEADAAEDKGSRHTMEDAWVLLLDASLDFPGKLRCAHFAIYDGHGGRLAAEHAQKHLHKNVLSSGLPRELLDVKATKKAILDGFRKTDESLLQESSAGGWQDGATAVCVWVLGQTVFVANVGDAKAVVARSLTTDKSTNNSNGGSSLKAIVLTREHKAIYPQERARIQKAGGVVGSNGRLQGRLEVSRAFGDRQFKKLGVIATPDIHSFELTDREHFIILGCDGLWGVFGPSDAVDFVQKLLKDGLSVASISRRLVREAIRERRCKDNCTAIVIVFRPK
ncbi:putative protein phosphatase 2C 8 isoform X1 [Cucumis melo var. makuwa]|uniref:protein-serine/threonine phosphatase n=2 Tax=Cucumis melo TaxID=3656 RepID=A0A5A7USH4_CUCMM|nr:probable protein phosphatase 2C 8 isoform X1 [Cucumis melo]KAA0058110.1 putative protein phosphatase 2C 8 isoform X1 [Cucumis melo var. makuwa]